MAWRLKIRKSCACSLWLNLLRLVRLARITTRPCVPPLTSGKPWVAIATPPERFGLFLEGQKYISLTFPGRSEGADIENTARVYPVNMLQGKPVANAYVVAFEEAANGDYQDAVFLIEGVKAVK